jgi:hypothetical protein
VKAPDIELLEALERHGVRVPPALRQAALVEEDEAVGSRILGERAQRRAPAGTLVRNCGRVLAIDGVPVRS